MKTIATVLFLLFLLFLTTQALADQKYEVDFELKYNAVTAQELGEILMHLEKLKGKHRQDPIKIEPCTWEIKIKGKAGTDELVSGTLTSGDWTTTTTANVLTIGESTRYRVDGEGRGWFNNGSGWEVLVPDPSYLHLYSSDALVQVEDGTYYKWDRGTAKWVRQ